MSLGIVSAELVERLCSAMALHRDGAGDMNERGGIEAGKVLYIKHY